jgi:toxin ParE1/3/4
VSSAYRVEFTKRAVRDLRLLFLAIHAEESPAAARWFDGLERSIGSLTHAPHRCPLAPEASARRLVRELLYGHKPHIYRVLYRVLERRKTVLVLHIRHGARRQAWGEMKDFQ